MKARKKIKTKERILQVAVKMFNEQGVQNVTSRHIANEMGIAYGNVDYHYKNKEVLLLAIYKEMRSEMSNSYLLREEYSTSLEHFHRLLAHLEQFQYKYRFFNLDVLEISRTYPKLNKILHKTIELRKEQMANLFIDFINDGYIEKRIDDRYNRLQHTIRVIITFWLSQEDVLSSFKYIEKGEMSRHIWELLLPYLTETGLKEFDRLVTRFGYL
ncbi:TetR/AcrR family transcriptional regulator [Arenibacter certesii]|uniref:TetR family transcriptional regulator n=1 Tax=Arenibacter certesii TaxID=228955 RepID=A0A918J514_9FLAO|nr:TetR/AcrR family transcriptional regulator [Arenibacter certesii]GGW47874.1 TetR family transcriptional regulator [Arenibacter certesii]